LVEVLLLFFVDRWLFAVFNGELMLKVFHFFACDVVRNFKIFPKKQLDHDGIIILEIYVFKAVSFDCIQIKQPVVVILVVLKYAYRQLCQ
jgi:hypothetical protein